jgi:hypothetical protein
MKRNAVEQRSAFFPAIFSFVSIPYVARLYLQRRSNATARATGSRVPRGHGGGPPGPDPTAGRSRRPGKGRRGGSTGRGARRRSGNVKATDPGGHAAQIAGDVFGASGARGGCQRGRGAVSVAEWQETVAAVCEDRHCAGKTQGCTSMGPTVAMLCCSFLQVLCARGSFDRARRRFISHPLLSYQLELQCTNTLSVVFYLFCSCCSTT